MKVYALLSGREALLGEAHSKEDVYQLAIKALCCSQPEDRLLGLSLHGDGLSGETSFGTLGETLSIKRSTDNESVDQKQGLSSTKVPPVRLERTTYGFEVRRSVH